MVAWELLEIALRRSDERDGGVFEYESPANIVADVVFGAVGWGLGRLLQTARWSGRREHR